jgi:hypothetical protein
MIWKGHVLRRLIFPRGLLVASLGILLGLGVFGTAIADHDENAPETGHQFLPWVPNGAMLGEQGPYYGSVTVQNLEADDAEVDIFVGGGASTDGWSAEGTLELSPNESVTLSAEALNIPADGAGVMFEGWLQR